MAYSIQYYYRPTLTSPLPDCDQIGDAALPTYPVPEFPECAIATHSENPELTRYGFRGGWWRYPPREAVEREYRDRGRVMEAQRRQGALDLMSAHGIRRVIRWWNGVTVVTGVLGAPRTRMCTWEAIHHAIVQSDSEAAALYRAISLLAIEQPAPPPPKGFHGSLYDPWFAAGPSAR